MRDTSLQFAVVREDPSVEIDLIANHNCGRALLIGSGGCTALSLQSRFPKLEITILDSNPAQLALIRRKAKALRETNQAEWKMQFNIGSRNPQGLNVGGNFESLFRLFRLFVEEFILSSDGLSAMFHDERQLARQRAKLLDSPYWPVAFELFFSDAMLLAMFGPSAIQHAAPRSYARYFQTVLENGLHHPQALKNYFLHHIFLGHYRDQPDCLPYYLANPATDFCFEFLEATALEVADFGRFDLVGLSNILDWLPLSEIKTLLARLRVEMKPGGVLVFRQLNHRGVFDQLLRPAFGMDLERNERMRLNDRSMFYSRLNIAIREQENG